MSIVYVISAIAGLYGLLFILFAFVNPPSALYYMFRAPSSVPLTERPAKVVTGLVLLAVSFFSSTIVSMFMR